MPRPGSGGQSEQVPNRGSEYLAVERFGSPCRKSVFQHFADDLPSSVGVLGAVVWIVPTSVPAVHQFLSGLTPAFQFHQRDEPAVQIPVTEVRPQAPDLRLPRSSADRC